MNFDDYSRHLFSKQEPNLALRLSASAAALVACFAILFLPREAVWENYVLISVCLAAAGLYFLSSHDEATCNKGWKMSFFLGILWFGNAILNLLMTLASYLPKT